jgi:Kef-type K+ transport system membrane component KefB
MHAFIMVLILVLLESVLPYKLRRSNNSSSSKMVSCVVVFVFMYSIVASNSIEVLMF